MTTTTLAEEYLSELECIPFAHVKKRITRELLKLEENCSLMSVECDLNDKDISGKQKPVLNIFDHTTNLTYSLTLDSSYPFRPPKVKINFKSYYEFLRTSSVNFSEILRKIHKINCLCCDTITCGHKWSPAFTTNHLIQEIRRLNGYKRDIINKLLADKIKFKYLIDDIDLDSWLF
jgi:ubiquitin-protein ligase